MVLNIKNLFKKVCILGASATMALGLCAPLANAAAPGSDTGKLRGAVTIAQSTTGLTVTINLKNNLTYTGSAQQLIDSVDVGGFAGTPGVKLYLRAVRPGQSASENVTWTLVSTDKDVDWQALNSITGNEPGEYNIYYYLDGNGAYPDINSTTP